MNVVSNRKQTGQAAAQASSKVLRDGQFGNAAKTSAASALAQTLNHHQRKEVGKQAKKAAKGKQVVTPATTGHGH
jgi:hypothetical protein